MNDNIKELLDKFKIINKMGYVETKRKGTTGIGYTLESLLNKEEDSNSLPDINGIELKAKLEFTKTPISLFSMVPKGKEKPLLYLVENFGYTKKEDPKKLKRFYNNCYFDKIAKENKTIYAELKLNSNKIVLEIKEKRGIIINKELYWNIDEVYERLCKKLPYLALCTAYKKTILNKDYYYYNHITIYKLKNDKNLLIKLIKENKIRIDFQIELKKENDKKILVHRDSVFRINRESIKELFIEIKKT